MATCICSAQLSHPSGCGTEVPAGQERCDWCLRIHTGPPRFRMLFSASTVEALHREIRAFCAELDAREAHGRTGVPYPDHHCRTEGLCERCEANRRYVTPVQGPGSTGQS